MSHDRPSRDGLLVPHRSHDPEIMDLPDNTLPDIRDVLSNIRTTNRLLGGRRTLLRGLRPLLLEADPRRTLTVLDVGTGSADLPLEMTRLADELGRSIRVTAIDRDSSAATIAEKHTGGTSGIRIVRADAFALPFEEDAFDIVTASLFLHHFSHEDVVRLLAEFSRLARRAVVVNDLRRHRLPWLAIQLLARATRSHPMFVHDAPLSVLRGFTAEELRRAAVESGARAFDLRRAWPFRLLLRLDQEARA